MQILRSITRKKLSLSIALVGLALALAPPGLAAIGYEISPRQGYVLLFLAGLCVVGAIAVLIWPDSHSDSEPETQEQRRAKEKLQQWRNKIDQWDSDKDNPLTKASPTDLRRRRVRRLTLEALRQQDPEGKRDILLTLYDWPLIQRGHYLVINLEGADFSGAHLEGINLQGASLRKVNLKDANLSGAQLGQVPEGVSAMNQIARLVKVAVAGNSLESCDLRGADLGGAILKNAVLAGCELVGVDLKGTDFREADLRAADFQGPRNLTQKQVNKAYGSCQQEEVRDTQLPDDLNAPKSWYKPIHQQKRERTLTRLERAHAGP